MVTYIEREREIYNICTLAENITFCMSEWNISLRVYLQMMYFLSVIGMGGSSVCVWRGVSFGCPRIFKIYAGNKS
jgi:hypothetical protein